MCKKTKRILAKRLLRLRFLSAMLVALSTAAQAEDIEVCVSNVQDLISVLHTAENHDGLLSVQVARGTYDFSGHPLFVDASTSSAKIFLRGGYVENCSDNGAGASFDPRLTKFINVPYFGIIAGTDIEAWGFTLQAAPEVGASSMEKPSTNAFLDATRVLFAAPMGMADLHHLVFEGVDSPVKSFVRVSAQQTQLDNMVVHAVGTQNCSLKVYANTSLVMNHLTVTADAGRGLCLDADAGTQSRVSNSVFVTAAGDNDVVLQTDFAPAFSHIVAGALPAGGTPLYAFEYGLGGTELFRSYADGDLHPSATLSQLTYLGARWPHGMNLEEPGNEHDVFYKRRFDSCTPIHRGAIEGGADVNEIVFASCFE